MTHIGHYATGWATVTVTTQAAPDGTGWVRLTERNDRGEFHVTMPLDTFQLIGFDVARSDAPKLAVKPPMPAETLFPEHYWRK